MLCLKSLNPGCFRKTVQLAPVQGNPVYGRFSKGGLIVLAFFVNFQVSYMKWDKIFCFKYNRVFYLCIIFLCVKMLPWGLKRLFTDSWGNIFWKHYFENILDNIPLAVRITFYKSIRKPTNITFRLTFHSFLNDPENEYWQIWILFQYL